MPKHSSKSKGTVGAPSTSSSAGPSTAQTSAFRVRNVSANPTVAAHMYNDPGTLQLIDTFFESALGITGQFPFAPFTSNGATEKPVTLTFLQRDKSEGIYPEYKPSKGSGWGFVIQTWKGGDEEDPDDWFPEEGKWPLQVDMTDGNLPPQLHFFEELHPETIRDTGKTHDLYLSPGFATLISSVKDIGDIYRNMIGSTISHLRIL